MMKGLKIRKSLQKSTDLLTMKSHASLNLDGFQFVFSLFIIGNLPSSLPFFYWSEYTEKRLKSQPSKPSLSHQKKSNLVFNKIYFSSGYFSRDWNLVIFHHDINFYIRYTYHYHPIRQLSSLEVKHFFQNDFEPASQYMKYPLE